MVAQELARHSTPVLTLGRYSHIGLHDTSTALNALPSLAPPTPTSQSQHLKKTGTDDVPPDPPTPRPAKVNLRKPSFHLASAGVLGRIPAKSGGTKTQEGKCTQVPAITANSSISRGKPSKPTAGVEPATYGLQNRCSAIELRRRYSVSCMGWGGLTPITLFACQGTGVRVAIPQNDQPNARKIPLLRMLTGSDTR
jgi:hypothetical protein